MYGATFLRTEKYVCDISLQLVLTSTRGCCLHFFANIKYIFSCDIYLLIPVCEKPADSVFKNKWEKCIESTWFFFLPGFSDCPLVDSKPVRSTFQIKHCTRQATKQTDCFRKVIHTEISGWSEHILFGSQTHLIWFCGI